MFYQEEEARNATLQRMLHGGRQPRRADFLPSLKHYPAHNTHIPYKYKGPHRTQKVLGEQAAWRPEASAANPLLPADPTGRIKR